MNEKDREVARYIRAQTLKLQLAHLEHLLADDDGEGGSDGAAMETKALATSLEEKQVDLASGVVTGYGSAWNVDAGNDRVERGAFSKALAIARDFARAHNSQSLFPILWQHNRLEPIGFISDAREDGKGLFCTFNIDPSTERGRQALYGLKHGSLSFSIGYSPVRIGWQGKTRLLKEVRLYEISVVTYPMNQEARATPDGSAGGDV